MRFLSLGFIAALIFGGVSVAQAGTTYYVRPGGNNSQCNGKTDVDYASSVAPSCAFASPKGCMGVMEGTSAGNDCFIHAGTYMAACLNGLNYSSGGFEFRQLHGTASDYAEIRAASGESPV